MNKIERFEDLIAWQKARDLTKEIYQVTRQGGSLKDFGLSGQIQRGRFEKLKAKAEEVGRIIGGLRASVGRQRATQASALSPQSSSLTKDDHANHPNSQSL